MQPRQTRLAKEKRELDEKTAKLSEFIGNDPLFEGVDPEEQKRMRAQCEIMCQYSEILGQRIAAFPEA